MRTKSAFNDSASAGRKRPEASASLIVLSISARLVAISGNGATALSKLILKLSHVACQRESLVVIEATVLHKVSLARFNAVHLCAQILCSCLAYSACRFALRKAPLCLCNALSNPLNHGRATVKFNFCFETVEVARQCCSFRFGQPAVHAISRFQRGNAIELLFEIHDLLRIEFAGVKCVCDEFFNLLLTLVDADIAVGSCCWLISIKSRGQILQIDCQRQRFISIEPSVVGFKGRFFRFYSAQVLTEIICFGKCDFAAGKQFFNTSGNFRFFRFGGSVVDSDWFDLLVHTGPAACRDQAIATTSRCFV